MNIDEIEYREFNMAAERVPEPLIIIVLTMHAATYLGLEGTCT